MRRILAAAVLAAAVLAAAATLATGCAAQTPPPVSDQVQKYYDENVTAAATQAAKARSSSVTVSVLSDSHAYNAGSWFRRTVEARTVPGVILGQFASQPGASAAALAAKVEEAAALKGVVIVQAGTNDLTSAVTPADTASNVEALVEGVVKRGAKPVLALIPPSDTRGDMVLQTNALLHEYATAHKVKVLDVTTPVIEPDGTWKPGLSGDGVHANEQGTKLMGAAAAKQLPALIR